MTTSDETPCGVTLRYVATSDDLMARTAFRDRATLDSIGARVMERLGITVPNSVRPIEAWLTTMAAENNLLDQRSIHPELLDALEGDAEAWRFFYALI